jgi:hypothetical protein
MKTRFRLNRRRFLVVLVPIAVVAIALWGVWQSDDGPSDKDNRRNTALIARACGEVDRRTISEEPVASGEDYPTLSDPDDNLNYSQPAEAMSYMQYKIREDNADAASFGKVYSMDGKLWVSCESPAVPIDSLFGPR